MTLRIPSPCHEDWNRMTPNERGRHCAACDKTVVDVTRMGPEAGARYLRRLPSTLAAGAKVCVHAHADARGRLLSPATRRLLTNGLAAVLAMSIGGCTSDGPQVAEGHTQTTAQPKHEPTPSRTAPELEGVVSVPMQGTVAPQVAPLPAIRGDVCEAPLTKGRVVATPNAGKEPTIPEERK